MLHRYSQEKTVVYGSTISGRQADIPGIEQQVGLFINTLPIVTTFNPSETASQYLKNFHLHFQEAQQYGYIPLWDIQRQSRIGSETSLFHYLFVFENYPIEGFQEGSNTLVQLGFEITDVVAFERTNYPLTIVCLEQHQQLNLKIDYAEGHFDLKKTRTILPTLAAPAS